MKFLVNLGLLLLSTQAFSNKTKVIYTCNDVENNQSIILTASFDDFEPMSMTYHQGETEFVCGDIKYYKIPTHLFITANISENRKIDFNIPLVNAQGRAVIYDYCVPIFDRYGQPKLVPSCQNMNKIKAYLNFSDAKQYVMGNCTVDFE